MEGAGGGLAAQPEPAETGAELARRFARERDDEHMAGIGGFGGEAIRHSPGEHPCLSRPRTRQDAQRGARARDRVALGGIQIVEQGAVESRAGVHRRHLRKGVGHGGVGHWGRSGPMSRALVPRDCGKAL